MGYGAHSGSDLKNSLESVPMWEWTWGRTLLTLILTPIVLGAIFGNLLVLYAFLTRPRDLRLPTHFFIANLALADFLVGVLAMPFLAVLQITDRWYFGSGFCSAWTIIHFWLCSSSILSTMSVCIERYIGVKYPLKHTSILSPRRIGWMVVAVWATAGTLTLSSVFIWPEPSSKGEFECRINQQIGHVIVVTVGVLYIPATVMLIFYWQIYVIASKHIKGMLRTKEAAGIRTYNSNSNSTEQEQESSFSTTTTSVSSNDPENVINGNGSNSSKSTSKNDLNVKSRKQINLAKKLAILVGVLLVSYIPFFTVFLINAFHPGTVSGTVFSTLGWIRYFNSCLNPFIYAYAIPGYRKTFKNLWTNFKSKFDNLDGNKSIA